MFYMKLKDNEICTAQTLKQLEIGHNPLSDEGVSTLLDLLK